MSMQSQKRPEELKREEQLFSYLCKSYQDYQRGNSVQINKIIDEVCRKNKEVSSIQQWIDLFMRLLVQQQRNGADAKLIIDIVLYKMPWFTSENHFKAISHLRKCLFTILSLTSAQITPIYRLLVQRFSEQLESATEFSIQTIVEIDQVYKLHRPKLLGLLADSLPHKNMSEAHWRSAVVNQLRLAERIPELIPKLFRQIFTKVLSIDAEIKQDPQFNNFIIKTTPRQPSQNVQRDETCCKLDRVLSLLLEFLAAKQGQASQNFSNERNDEALRCTFVEMQEVFRETMLKGSPYRMAQFVLFYFCSLGGEHGVFQKRFMSQLILQIQKHEAARNVKINSIYYLSSLLVRCNMVAQGVFQKAVLLVLEYLRANTRDLEVNCHLVQMLAFLVSTKASQMESIKAEVHAAILQAHQGYSALNYLHYDILVKFNSMLLRSSGDPSLQQLIDITANRIMRCQPQRQGEHDNHTTNPNTPQLFIMDHESHMSRQSVWTSNSSRNNQLEFYQPFNQMTLIYGEKYIAEAYKKDAELLKDEGGSPNSSHLAGVSPIIKIRKRAQLEGEQLQKRVKY